MSAAIPACESSPRCVNDGICTSMGPFDFTCHCVVGYTGSICEVNIDDCVSVTCPPTVCVWMGLVPLSVYVCLDLKIVATIVYWCLKLIAPVPVQFPTNIEVSMIYVLCLIAIYSLGKLNPWT